MQMHRHQGGSKASAGHLGEVGLLALKPIVPFSIEDEMMRHAFDVSLTDRLPIGGAGDGMADSQEEVVLQEVIRQSMEDQAPPVE